MSVIQVQNISKQYRLGQVGTGTLSHDLNRWWYKVRGLEDPYLRIGEENDRARVGNSEYAWVLKDINFEVREGQVMGIIGRNGAGKSTLLKILCRITAPTSGQVKLKGRVASLLEVGTGFHPDLTGRENVYLNGAIMGMTKAEVKGKFDEIVSFSEVARYIDTPVKRYSSGMYVRLAFAVAAHLDSEILIVDEVLAVGDADFQKKCMGKMKSVSGSEGRTVLFVSHNINAILSLTNEAVFLEKGRLIYHDKTERVVEKYVQTGTLDPVYTSSNYDRPVFFETISTSVGGFIHNDAIRFDLTIVSDEDRPEVALGLGIQNIYEESVGNRILDRIFSLKKGSNRFTLLVSNHALAPGEYKGVFAIAKAKTLDPYDTVIGVAGFNIFNDEADSLLLSKWNRSFGSHYLRDVKIEVRED